MNSPNSLILVVVVIGIAALFITGSYMGRKTQEWKNLARIVVGVGAFCVGWRVLMASSLGGWTKITILAGVCGLLWLLNLIKQFAQFRQSDNS